MTELRLVPAALAVWAASLVCVLVGPAAAALVVLALAVGCACWREWGQAVLVAGLGAAATVVATVRIRIAAAWDFAEPIVGTVSGQPKQLTTGSWLTRITLPGHPPRLRCSAPRWTTALCPAHTSPAPAALANPACRA
ncbi:hypothetical protein [Corynebacterium aquatimens]|uniref:hypothetical protein n=1 Tax=Corynebacterium aquatimens TaxID=1190508 RepID=UPI003314467A